MKNKKQSKSLTGLNKITIAISGSLSLMSTAGATEISTYIPSAKEEAYKEQQANLWFTLDDSGSMGTYGTANYRKKTGRKKVCVRWGRWGANCWQYGYQDTYTYSSHNYIIGGYIPYDPNQSYKLPHKIDGSLMPLLNSLTKVYIDPFISNANNSSYVYYGKKLGEPYLTDGYINSFVTCENAENKENCKIWANYYRTRLLTLKSSLSTVMFSEENKKTLDKLRIGYQSLRDKGQLIPVMPLYGDNSTKNQNKFKKWLYKLEAGHMTPLREKASGLLKKLAKHAPIVDKNNIFIEKPGQQYQKEKNKLLYCRRNYSVLLTDGGWNSSANTTVNNDISKGHIKSNGVNYKDELPDGRKYLPITPYKNSLTYNSTNASHPYQGKPSNTTLTLADIAFAGWKTDLDSNTDNNDLKIKTNKVNNKVMKLNDDEYWHPYNDPASWQHLNTFAIGFGLDNPNNIDINPNGTGNQPIDNYLNNGWVWNLTYNTVYNSKWYSDNPRLSEYDDSSVKDLANAALASRGNFYDVQTASDMEDAFSNIFNAVENNVSSPTSTGSSGVVGSSQQIDSSFFSTRYDIKNGTGSVMKLKVFDGTDADSCFSKTPEANQIVGAVCDKETWDVGKILSSTALTDRNIFSVKRTKENNDLEDLNDLYASSIGEIKYKPINFPSNDISPLQKQKLINNFSDSLKKNFNDDEERLEKLFAYIKGSKANEDDIFRDRSGYTYRDGSEGRNILGSIVRMQPVYAGVPKAYTENLDRHGDAYKNYREFIVNFTSNNTESEKEILYVGANDGMLHAFSANTGKELFSYLPASIYNKLPETTEPGKKVTLLDGNMTLQTVNFGSDSTDNNNNSDWNRILVGSFGAGGKGLFSLNVTNPSKAAITQQDSESTKVWEYSDYESILYQKKKANITDAGQVAALKSNIGNVMAKPTIMQLHDNTWVALIGNGYNSDSGKAVLIVIDLKTGQPIQELVLEGDASQENGLGPVTIKSYPSKPSSKQHLADRAYAGDLQGNLWVFDLEGSNKDDGIKLAKSEPLFKAITKDGESQPITVPLQLVTHPRGYGNLIHFGTGSLFSRDDKSSKVQNSIYAIWDDWIEYENKGLPEPRTKPVKLDELNNIVLTGATKLSGSETKATQDISENQGPTKWKLGGKGSHRGWKVDLDKGERAWQDGQIEYNGMGSRVIRYKTANYHANSNDKSESDGTITCKSPKQDVKGGDRQFNLSDASKRIKGFGMIDVNGNGKLDKGDKSSTTGKAVASVTTEGEIGYNTVTSITGEKSPESGPNSLYTNSNCKVMTVTNKDDHDNITAIPIKVCSSFSSWKELK